MAKRGRIVVVTCHPACRRADDGRRRGRPGLLAPDRARDRRVASDGASFSTMTHRFQSWPAIAGRPASTILSGRDSRDVLSDAYAYPILDDYDIAAGNQMVVGTDFDRVVE